MLAIIVALAGLYLLAVGLANDKISRSETKFDEAQDVTIDYEDLDSIKEAYDRGDLTEEDIQQLYDSGAIDEIEADFIDPDAVPYDDNEDFEDSVDERDDFEDYDD